VPERGDDERYVTVARLVRTQGRRGELAAELEADDASVFEAHPDVMLLDGAGRREPFRVRHAWPHKNRIILSFEGVDSISAAELLAGRQVQIPAGERGPAPPGRFYQSDLIGCRVVDAHTDRELGEVRRLVETGAALLLEVVRDEEEILVPFAAAICVEIDTAARVIRVNLPEGLEGLSRR